jgi:hypothetical protein
MPDTPGNDTPNTPGVSETDLRDMTVVDLRDRAKKAGVDATSEMRKDELVAAVARAEGGSSGSSSAGAGPDGGHLRTGPGTSDSLKYAQEVTSTDDEPEREGRSLVTTNHDVIREWAEARDGTPATVEGTEHGDHLGVLRFDFGGDDDQLRHVGWDEWFATFDDRRLNFIYQEKKSDGSQSTFFRLENPDREDA